MKEYYVEAYINCIYRLSANVIASDKQHAIKLFKKQNPGIVRLATDYIAVEVIER